MNKREFNNLLVSTILESIDANTRDFHWDGFFRRWFRENGNPLFFLFRKHLGVTNVQYVELYSLLEIHCHVPFSNRKRQHLLLHTTQQLRTVVVEIVNQLLDASEEERQKRIKEFVDLHSNLFASSIVVDQLYCSCAVFLPPGMEVELERLVVDSGYIHSAGQSVFVRNIVKSKKHHLESAIDAFLDKESIKDFKVPFVVYAHEDFTGYDKTSEDRISRGIENTKIYLEKQSMGAYSLSDIVNDLRNTYKEELIVPEAGDYKTNHDFEVPVTLWLLMDRSISNGDPRNPGRTRYYICYAQKFKNSSPYFYFNENKPAWKSHTTLPHSLTAALLNAAVSELISGYARKRKKISVCDPFGGTGTTWLEAIRLGVGYNIRCSDLSLLTNILVQDNLKFFLCDNDSLQELKKEFKAMEKWADTNLQSFNLLTEQGTFNFGSEEYFPISKHLLEALKVLEKIKSEQPNEEFEYTISEQIYSEINVMSFKTRLIFYIFLRSELRFRGGYSRNAITREQAFLRSLRKLNSQIKSFAQLKYQVNEKMVEQSEKKIVVFKDKYSNAVISQFYDRNYEKLYSKLKSDVSSRNAIDFSDEKYDIILCDPPYGFNTTEDDGKLARLYNEFIDQALRALNPGGHLILCLPAESYTGKDLPYCTNSSLVVKQVLLKAQELKLELIHPARDLPSKLFTPPYYWEAERALRRVILHFQVS